METEVKYLVTKTPKKYESILNFTQIYFDINKKRDYLKTFFPENLIDECVEGRIRFYFENNPSDYKNFVLTLKGNGTLSRQEIEETIGEDIAYTLLNQATLGIVRKDRYFTTISEDCRIETDVYKDAKPHLIGAITSEVEYPLSGFPCKDYFTRKNIDKKVRKLVDSSAIDVTEDKDFKNKNIAREMNQEELDILFNSFKQREIKI